MKKGFYLLLFLLGLSNPIFCQDIFEINTRLGKGVNMGNMFEAPSETEWGNPFRDDYFSIIADLGFNHIRLPIRWDVPNRASQTAPYTINPEFLERIKFVVDKAREEDLMVMMNMHHHDELFEDPAGNKDRFLAQWTQISNYFKDYDENVLFEVLNEPHGNLSPELWNVYFLDALDIIREENPTRAVVMGIAEFGGLRAVPKIILPDDPNIILSIHYYEPFTFTHQGAEWVNGSDPWLGTKWTNNTLEQDAIKSQFDFAKNFARENNVPINIGEFGAYSKADQESRLLWTNFLARWFEEEGYSWAYWEFSAGFGFYDPNSNQVKQDLADALLKNPSPEPVVVEYDEIYSEDFSNGAGGWNLNVSSPASASVSIGDKEANINVSQVANEAWRVQFVKNSFNIVNGKTYLATFDAKADGDVSITSYIGKASAPFNGYSGFTGFGVSTDFKSYQFVFTMNEATDPQARFVFDLGGSVGNVTLANPKVFEITTGNEAVLLAAEENEHNFVYPNPTSEFIMLNNADKAFERLQLVSAKGAVLLKKALKPTDEQRIDLPSLQAGLYILQLSKGTTQEWRKLVIH